MARARGRQASTARERIREWHARDAAWPEDFLYAFDRQAEDLPGGYERDVVGSWRSHRALDIGALLLDCGDQAGAVEFGDAPGIGLVARTSKLLAPQSGKGTRCGRQARRA